MFWDDWLLVLCHGTEIISACFLVKTLKVTVCFFFFMDRKTGIFSKWFVSDSSLSCSSCQKSWAAPLWFTGTPLPRPRTALLVLFPWLAPVVTFRVRWQKRRKVMSPRKDTGGWRAEWTQAACSIYSSCGEEASQGGSSSQKPPGSTLYLPWEENQKKRIMQSWDLSLFVKCEKACPIQL